MRKVKVVSGIMISLFFLTLCVASTWAAAIEIKFAHVDPPDVCTSKKGAAGAAFKNLVEAETAGGVEVKVFPAGQLGGERELIEATKLGTIQMSMVSAAIAGYYKEAQVLDIPYLFSSAPVAWKVMDGGFGKEMAEDCLKKTGMRVLAYGETGFRNFTNSVRPIKSPADMKGLKIRVMESPVYINMVKALGAAPTPIAWPETYTALQQKVVDGQENPVSVILSVKFFEVQKYIILDGHSYGVDFILVNDSFFQKLPKETQQILKTAAINAGYIGRSIQQLNSALGVAQLKEKGMEVYSPNPKEREMFREAAQKPVVEYIEKQIGRSWIDKLMKAVKEAEAELAK
ncbi:MAG: C4-dicarboxylate ABC transporter substrate-binding protein [Deltaproteobacteria bacterium RBG_16_48_10]|nr:MAG: C4-dicarboxylate ABC transporter substrate-binding protein [Deltaproteobacteria bacterium RBG_16_48_10]